MVHPEGIEPPTFWFVARHSNPTELRVHRERGDKDKGTALVQALVSKKKLSREGAGVNHDGREQAE